MVLWEICFWIGLGFFVLIPCIGFYIRFKNIKEDVHYRYFLFAGILLSAIVWMIPIQWTSFSGKSDTFLHTIVTSINYVLQMFSLNANHDPLESFSPKLSPCLSKIYIYFISFDFLTAPLMTFSIVAMFFRNFTATINYLWHYRQDVHVFSDLNEKSLALANSIKNEHKDACIVFTNVSEEIEQKASHLIKKTRKIQAICYRKDILSTNLGVHSKRTQLKLYTINENEAINIEQSAQLIEKYKKAVNSYLYVFTSRPECEYLLDKKAGEKDENSRIITRRINVVSSLINRTLYENGCELLYDSASEGTPRKISVILIGLGQHGIEMLKSLVWFCQMYDYKLEINAYDKNPNVFNQLKLTCEELFEYQDSLCGKTDPGYLINVHPNTDTESIEFIHGMESITDPAYVFVALGDDETNIRTAINIRMIFEQMATITESNPHIPKRPRIQAIVYNSGESKILKNINNYKKQEYEIDFIGDIESSYTEKVLINSDLEIAAKAIHEEHGNADTFYDYEYYYRSSCASAIHNRAIAWQLKKTGLDENIIEKTVIWLKLAYHLCDLQNLPDLDDKEQDRLNSWATETRALVDSLCTKVDFCFSKWNDRTLISRELLQQKCKQVEELNKLYNSFVPSFKKQNDNPTKSFSLSSAELQSKNATTNFDPEETVYYFLLVVKLMMLEHQRWSAYMRSIGYKHGKKRNDLGKIHPDLCPFDKLQENEKVKDLHVQLLIKHHKQILEHANPKV